MSKKATDIRQVEDKELLITWEDGERTLYSNVYLQLSCPCARCVDEWTGERIIQEDQIDPNVKIRQMESVGNYAVKFVWSVGCQSGIFSYDYLYKIRPNQPQ